MLVGMIGMGGLASRSASYIHIAVRDGSPPRLALQFLRRPTQLLLLRLYVIAGIPLAFLNGFLLRLSWIDSVIAGVGTWAFMLLSIRLARRFNPTVEFFTFGAVSVLWVAVNLAATILRA
jgi:hypothetical protein